MKKLSVLFLIGLSSTMLLFGCGKDKEEKQETITITEGIASETQSEEPSEEEASTETEEEESVEGKVRNPLTNEWIDEELADKRPIAVMYPINKEAMPQYGYDNIDVFYEILEEGKMSRQMAIMKDWENLEQIGNIRSIRDYFVYPALEYDSIIVHFGGPELYVTDILSRADVENINGTGGSKMGSDYGAFFRVPRSGVAQEHTAYTSGEKLQAAIEKAGFSKTYRDVYKGDHFTFADAKSPNTLENGEAATKIDMSSCFPVTKPVLTYNEEDGLYYREIYGKPQVDAVTDNQLAFANVIVQNTYFEQRDPKGYLYFQMFDTTRDGYFFTQGKAIPITWKHSDKNGIDSNYEPTKYYDKDGKEIVLNTGKTMIFIVEDGDPVKYN